jgi:hypothetical protein
MEEMDPLTVDLGNELRITDEEFALFEYIDTEHRCLSARVDTSRMMSECQV